MPRNAYEAVPAVLLTLALQAHSPCLAMSGALASHTLKIALASVTGQAAGVGLISGQVASPLRRKRRKQRPR